MKTEHLLSGPPVTLSNSQPMRQSRHSDTAQAFQDGLQRISSKAKEDKLKRWKK